MIIGGGGLRPTRHHGLRCLAMYEFAAPALCAMAKNESTFSRSDFESSPKSEGRSITRRRADSSRRMVGAPIISAASVTQGNKYRLGISRSVSRVAIHTRL